MGFSDSFSLGGSFETLTFGLGYSSSGSSSMTSMSLEEYNGTEPEGFIRFCSRCTFSELIGLLSFRVMDTLD